jgi:hypothetical protein
MANFGIRRIINIPLPPTRWNDLPGAIVEMGPYVEGETFNTEEEAQARIRQLSGAEFEAFPL